VPKLLAGGAELTVIARDPRRVAGLADQGVHVVSGSSADRMVVRRAVSGADTLFWLTPPDYRQPDPLGQYRRFTNAALDGLDARNPPRVVTLSAIGANLPKGTGPVAGLYQMEQKFNNRLASVTHLRPTFFMENMLNYLPTIVTEGVFYVPMPGNQPHQLVAIADIAEAAAERLLSREWEGQHVRHLLGPEDITYQQVAEILSEELERPVRFSEISLEQAYDALVGQGLNPEGVAALIELSDWARHGMPGSDATRTPETTTATGFRQFAREVFKPAYRQAATPVAGSAG
jgi:uncharacterized protein YbjT (DUF2867 family)